MTMVMDAPTVTATRLKAQLLALLDEVAETGRPLIVTKRGKPVAKIVPVEPPPSLVGTVRFLVDDDQLLEPVGGPWDAAGR
jgi:prevent-host-death family protein